METLWKQKKGKSREKIVEGDKKKGSGAWRWKKKLENRKGSTEGQKGGPLLPTHDLLVCGTLG